MDAAVEQTAYMCPDNLRQRSQLPTVCLILFPPVCWITASQKCLHPLCWSDVDPSTSGKLSLSHLQPNFKTSQVLQETVDAGRRKCGRCPLNSSQIPFNYRWFSCPSSSLTGPLVPHSSFFLLLPVQTPSALMSLPTSFISHAWNRSMELTNGDIMEQLGEGPSNPSWFCRRLK